MEKSKFTPGPWQTRDDESLEGRRMIIANVDGEILHDGPHFTYDTIAVCEDEYGESLPNAPANARLIAAAPEMYEALRSAKALLDNINEFGTITDCEFLDGADTRVRAALAKAEGREG